MKSKVKSELDWICTQVEKNIEIFGDRFPSACTTEGKYRIKDNDDWTNGFWTGMLWMCYEYSGKDIFKSTAMKNGQSFIDRIEKNFVLDHHDIGFLYMPSLVAEYRLTGNAKALKYSLKAANKLIERYQTRGKFLQAWGEMDCDEEYRFIVDSLINLPILYFASEISGDSKYKTVADAHFSTVIKYGIREDFSTHHTFYFNRMDGKPLGGKTAQGFSDNSCWARGQAWVLLGLILNNKYQENKSNYKLFTEVYRKYHDQLPDDLIPYWDLIFNDDSNQYHDASTTPIIITALLEYKNQFKETKYDAYIEKMTISLIEKYSSKYNKKSQGLLDYGVYAYHGFKGINESNLWGDYFYLESLYKIYTNNEWKGYF